MGISAPDFMAPSDVIFNFSSRILSDKEKFLLSLGLDFRLPNVKLNFASFFLPFEKMFSSISSLPAHINLDGFRFALKNIAYKGYSTLNKKSWLPFLKDKDFALLRNLAKDKNLVVSRPDKGRGVVLMDRDNYVSKMNSILSDETKFAKIGPPSFGLIFKLEDKINRWLKQLLDGFFLTQASYQSLFSSGSSYSALYGLPKVHKPNLPLRPILAAYNSPNFKIAKFLVPLLSPLCNNKYSIKNSFNFASTVRSLDSSKFMVSFDVENLFTNVPLAETIQIILDRLFVSPDTTYQGFTRDAFRKLLEIAVLDTHIVFDGVIFKQVDGVAMGSPLGPIFANVFMSSLEEDFLDNCPLAHMPSVFFRYVDDTFALFSKPASALAFLKHINSMQPNISFTMEPEKDGSLSFLDVRIMHTTSGFTTSVFRKSTFTGLGSNFYSSS
ncbi:MAG: reverse transcriptase domain-containing protein, partial [Rickettsia sp.]